MRFLEGGLDIPDELLHRRDAGQVVFFCGAGVSKQAAGLLNFAELLDNVSTALGEPGVTRDAGNDTATHSRCLSIDQQFTRLERLYLRERIEDLVTEFLRPRAHLNPEIHKTLVDLARATDGRLRLITSNFDHLFDAHTQAGQRYLPPNLPDFDKVDDFDGIVQLHGRLPDTDDRRSGAPLILSSIDFATAYLSRGKGTREFIHEILERYIVVFIGYTGNDVPISYILDGISRSERRGAVYAFVEKSEEDAWKERGVSTVTYNACQMGHSELWDTLRAWAHYARDPHKWQQAVMRRAESGPQALAEYERGQIAYVVSSTTGAKLLGQFNLPATWLFVFDKHLRNAHTERQRKQLAFKLLLGNAADIELSLESDRNTPTLGNKWDAFEPQPSDKTETVGVQKLSGLNTGDCPLSQRVHHILQWLFSNLSQRETLIWARFTPSLSATIVEQLTEHVVKWQRTMSPSTLTAWTYLIQALRRRNSSHYSDMLFARQVSRSGLSTVGAILDFIVSIRPFLSHHPESLLPLIDFFDEPDPNSLINTLQLRVGWPKTGFIDVSQLSPRLLETLFDGLISNIGYVIELYKIIGCESETTIFTMVRCFDHRDDGNSDSNGVGYHFSLLTRVFERLLCVDHERASVTMTSLGTQSCAACAILKVWMLGQFANENPNLLGHELLNLDSRWFFCSELSTKIMDIVAAVWMQLRPRIRSSLEARLAAGCSDRPDYDRNVQKLGRLEFLKEKGVRLSQKANRLLTDLNREISATQSRLLSRCENPWLIPESEWSNRGPLPWTSIFDVSSVSAYIQNHKNDE
ncbi:MAG: SIR2 family protein, partial [Planctomyces sp.]